MILYLPFFLSLFFFFLFDIFQHLLYFYSDVDKDNTAIIVGVTVPIVLLLALLGIGLLVRRRRSQGRKTTETRTTDNLSLPDSVIDTRSKDQF